MIWFWTSVSVAAIASAAWIARPLLRATSVEVNEADSAISVFRDQADEIKRDLKSGLISEAEFDAAQEEIEARALNAARNLGQGMSVTRRAPIAAAAIIAMFAVGSFGLYSVYGTPQAPDHPLLARKHEALEKKAAAGDIGSRIALLIDATKEDPESFQSWWMLARSYAATGDNASAADAYRKAAELSGDRPAVLSAYAEALTLANGNKVPQAARLVFQQILAKTPDPRARYYLALAKAQAQDFRGALEDWAIMANESEENAPWMPLVRRDIVNMARFLEEDVTQFLPNATPDEVARSGGAPVDNTALAARAKELDAALAADPKDYKSWLALAETRSALGDGEAAANAVASAREQFAAAPFVLNKIDEAARRLGIDLVASASVSGPSAEDIAAATAMSEEDQASMIAGMVAGLAAKLEENPDNPDGWIMLVRSYAVIGEMEKARTAYDKALAQYEENQVMASRIAEEAGALIGVN